MKRFAGTVAVLGALVVFLAGKGAGLRFGIADGSDRSGRPALPVAGLPGSVAEAGTASPGAKASPAGEWGLGTPATSSPDGGRPAPAPAPDADANAEAPKTGRPDAAPPGASPKAGGTGARLEASDAGADEAPADPFALPAVTEEVADPLWLLVLVNKRHRLPADFRPPDLVPANIPFDKPERDERRLMRQEAARAIEALFRAAEADGIHLIGVSAFRSYEL